MQSRQNQCLYQTVNMCLCCEVGPFNVGIEAGGCRQVASGGTTFVCLGWLHSSGGVAVS